MYCLHCTYISYYTRIHLILYCIRMWTYVHTCGMLCGQIIGKVVQTVCTYIHYSTPTATSAYVCTYVLELHTHTQILLCTVHMEIRTVHMYVHTLYIFLAPQPYPLSTSFSFSLMRFSPGVTSPMPMEKPLFMRKFGVSLASLDMQSAATCVE